MPPTVKVKSSDAIVKRRREAAAYRVIDHFGNRLTDRRLLCFLDDEDCHTLKTHFGHSNRGFYAPIGGGNFWSEWPDYLKECVLVEEPSSLLLTFVFDHVIYLHGSTCANEIGLAMTFAHELQHFVQHITVPKIRAQNSLIQNLPKNVINALGVKWCDIPIEREARFVSKQTAEKLFGAQPVRRFIDSKIAEALDPSDADDWLFIQTIQTYPSRSYDLAAETARLFQRLKPYRSELEKLLHQVREDPDFKDIDLTILVEGASQRESGPLTQ